MLSLPSRGVGDKQVARPDVEGETLAGRTREEPDDEILVRSRGMELNVRGRTDSVGKLIGQASLAGSGRTFKHHEAPLAQNG